MRKFIHVIVLAGFLLAGCGTGAPAAPTLPFILVTAAPNASPTPTPFQPIPWTPTGTLPLAGQPIVDTAAPTATLPAPTQTLPPTIDPNILINTVMPFSTI